MEHLWGIWWLTDWYLRMMHVWGVTRCTTRDSSNGSDGLWIVGCPFWHIGIDWCHFNILVVLIHFCLSKQKFPSLLICLDNGLLPVLPQAPGYTYHDLSSIICGIKLNEIENTDISFWNVRLIILKQYIAESYGGLLDFSDFMIF